MTRSHGFVALISVLIISAICLLVGSGVLLRSIDEGNIAIAQEQAYRAHAAAAYCAEEALMQLQQNKFYAGNQTLTLFDDTCRIRLITKSGATYTVQTTSTVMGATRKFSVLITKLRPTMIISSWQEVTDF